MNVPNHPMIVHFPIVLAILLPVFAVGTLWVMRSKRADRQLWALPLAISILLFGSAFAATRTGEADEERVEDVVPERVLHEHEEAAERFLVLAGIVTVVAAAGLARGITGSAARLVATAGSFVVVLAGYQVGHAGGELVYVHNAGAAYSVSGSQANNESEDITTKQERDDHD
jgi:uncharacterized membrane protein